jgi:hypothetical protein
MMKPKLMEEGVRKGVFDGDASAGVGVQTLGQEVDDLVVVGVLGQQQSQGLALLRHE